MALKNNQQGKTQGGNFKKDQEPTRYGQSSQKDIDVDQNDDVDVNKRTDMGDDDLDDTDDDIRK